MFFAIAHHSEKQNPRKIQVKGGEVGHTSN